MARAPEALADAPAPATFCKPLHAYALRVAWLAGEICAVPPLSPGRFILRPDFESFALLQQPMAAILFERLRPKDRQEILFARRHKTLPQRPSRRAAR